MRTVYVNGKFTAQRTTGVQRVAGELLHALDRRLAAGPAPVRLVLLMPGTGAVPVLRHIEVRVVAGPSSGHLWEQTVLPWQARDGLLLNLSGSAPALARAQVCVLHDAAVFDCPRAYTALFGHWYRWLFRRLGRRAAGLFTVSDFSRTRLSRALGVADDAFRLLPLGAEHLASVEADGTGLDRLPAHGFVLAVGSANPTKNFAGLLRAWAAVGRPDARLVLVGGTHDAVFQGAALPAAHGVELLGPVSDARLKALYGRAAGLIFPSLYEGFGLPVLEAMACGCPVAASTAASLPEVCGDAAWMFDAADDGALRDALRRLLDDAPLRDDLRARGLARARRFTWERSAAVLMQSLKELA